MYFLTAKVKNHSSIQILGNGLEEKYDSQKKIKKTTAFGGSHSLKDAFALNQPYSGIWQRNKDIAEYERTKKEKHQ